MRTTDVQVGETYQVKVPQRLPPALRDRLPATPHELAAYMRLHSLRGDRFDLTVTVTADTTVDGYETTHTSRVSLPLSAEQADALGLAQGPAYAITGYVTDDQDEEVTFPSTIDYRGLPAAARHLLAAYQRTYMPSPGHARAVPRDLDAAWLT